MTRNLAAHALASRLALADRDSLLLRVVFDDRQWHAAA